MKKTLVYLFAVLITVSSCKKEDTDLLVPDNPSPSTTWYSVIPDTASSRKLRTDLSYDLPADSFTVFSSGTTGYGGGPIAGLFLSIPQAALTNDSTGQPFYGMAYASMALLKTKGDYIRMGIPTTSNNALLVAGGATYIKLQDNMGNNLSVTPGRNITITYEDTPIVPQMKVYYGNQFSPGSFNWTAATDLVLNNVGAGTNFYLMSTSQLGWVGSSYPSGGGSTGETKIALDIPSHYTNANSIAFISFDDMRTVVALDGDAVTRQFRSGSIPVGRQATVIVMSKQVNDYFIGSTQIVTTSSSSEYQTVTVNPTISTLQNIENYLSTL